MVIKFKKRPILSIGKTLSIFIVLCISFLFLVLFWPQNNTKFIRKITVESGLSLDQISDILYEKKIIKNKDIFSFAVKLLGMEKKIPIGTFKLVNANSNYEIINQLIYGAPEVKKVMILEGWTLNQIANNLQNELQFDSLEIINLFRDQDFLKKNGINSPSLEGYLYPDTYYFFVGDNPKNVLSQLISMHSSFWTNSFKNRAKKLNMTKHEVVTLASIIEGEAIYNSERAKISAVYHNRLKIGMKLQADPTIQYIIPDSPRRLFNRDLKIKSPYNTYLHKGLPPGPINSPGRNSLIAALYPEHNDFLFFVATGDGYHTFSTNERDHNKAKRKLQKLRKKIKRKNKK